MVTKPNGNIFTQVWVASNEAKSQPSYVSLLADHEVTSVHFCMAPGGHEAKGPYFNMGLESNEAKSPHFSTSQECHEAKRWHFDMGKECISIRVSRPAWQAMKPKGGICTWVWKL